MSDPPTPQITRGRRIGVQIDRLSFVPVRFERRPTASLRRFRVPSFALRTPLFARRPRGGGGIAGRKSQERFDEFERFEKRRVPKRSYETNTVPSSASAAKPHAVVGFALGEKRKTVRATAKRTRTIGLCEVSGVHPGCFKNLRPTSFGRPKDPIDALAVLHAC